MLSSRHAVRLREARTAPLALACLLLLAGSLAGCKQAGRSVEPRFRKIDSMLSAKLPQGTARGRVVYFLSSRGYAMEDAADNSSVVATVQLVDTDTLQPVAARVIFHFDANDKLASYELHPAPAAPLRP